METDQTQTSNTVHLDSESVYVYTNWKLQSKEKQCSGTGMKCLVFEVQVQSAEGGGLDSAFEINISRVFLRCQVYRAHPPSLFETQSHCSVYLPSDQCHPKPACSGPSQICTVTLHFLFWAVTMSSWSVLHTEGMRHTHTDARKQTHNSFPECK